MKVRASGAMTLRSMRLKSSGSAGSEIRLPALVGVAQLSEIRFLKPCVAWAMRHRHRR